MTDSILTFMREQSSYATMQELKKAGGHPRKIKQASNEGVINKIKPGLYKLRNYQRDEYESFVDINTANEKLLFA